MQKTFCATCLKCVKKIHKIFVFPLLFTHEISNILKSRLLFKTKQSAYGWVTMAA